LKNSISHNWSENVALQALQTPFLLFLDIFYPRDFGCLEENGLFQHPQAITKKELTLGLSQKTGTSVVQQSGPTREYYIPFSKSKTKFRSEAVRRRLDRRCWIAFPERPSAQGFGAVDYLRSL
jgi:hypothetical protein